MYSYSSIDFVLKDCCTFLILDTLIGIHSLVDINIKTHLVSYGHLTAQSTGTLQNRRNFLSTKIMETSANVVTVILRT